MCFYMVSYKRRLFLEKQKIIKRGGSLSVEEKRRLGELERGIAQEKVKSLSRGLEAEREGRLDIERQELEREIVRQSPEAREQLRQANLRAQQEYKQRERENIERMQAQAQARDLLKKETKGQRIAQETRKRAGLGIYTQVPLEREIKVEFQEPKETFTPANTGNIFTQTFRLDPKKTERLGQQTKKIKQDIRYKAYKLGQTETGQKVKNLFKPIKADPFRRAKQISYLTFGTQKVLFEKAAKKESNKFLKGFYKTGAFTSETLPYTIKAYDETLRTPSTYAIVGVAGGFSKAVPFLRTTAGRVSASALYGGASAFNIATSSNRARTTGQALGTYGGFMTAGYLAQGVTQTSKALYTRAKSEYQFKFKSPERTIYDPTKKYVSFTGRGQRTLYGYEAPKRVYDTSKIGFGIERSTLRRPTTLLERTGQQKLFQDQIVAISRTTGLRYPTRISPTKDVFVYNPRLDKFVEFNPNAFRLRTINPQFSAMRLGGTFTTPQTTQQTDLFKFGFKQPPPKVTTPFNIKTPPKTPKPTNLKTTSFFTSKTSVGAGVGTTQAVVKTKTDLFPTLKGFSSSSYVVDTPTPQPAITSKGTPLSKDAIVPFRFNVPRPSGRERINYDVGIGFDLPFKPTSISEPKTISRPKIDLGKDIDTGKRIDFRVGQAQAQRQDLDLRQRQIPRQQFTQTSTFSYKFLPRTTSRSKTKLQRGITPPPYLSLGVPYLRRFKAPKFGTTPLKTNIQPRGYKPSVRAALFGLRGKFDPIAVKTGLGERVIIDTKKKKRLLI